MCKGWVVFAPSIERILSYGDSEQNFPATSRRDDAPDLAHDQSGGHAVGGGQADAGRRRSAPVLVQEAGHYNGIVSESDLVRKGMAESCPAQETLVRAVMSSPLLAIDITSSAHEASEKMAEHGIRHLAISEEGQIVGIISVRDLLRYFKNWGGL